MHNPLEQFEIKKLYELSFMGYDISFTNSSLTLLIASLFIMFLLALMVQKSHMKPGKLQVALEMFYSTVLDMVESTAGKDGAKYVPLVFTLFIFILSLNLLGMMPSSFTVTSHIAVTFALAIFIFLLVTTIGFIKHGLHFFSFFLPSGVPVIMAPLIIPIELFAYLARPISLSVRLAANMTAGHIVLKVLASFAIMAGALGVIPFALLIAITGFEFFVAILQAYIFSILTCVYLSDALNLH